MFKLTYKKYGTLVTEDKKDIDGINQCLISIIKDPSAEKEAIDWCSKATFGQFFVNQKYKFKIECYRENNKINNLKSKNTSTINSMQNSDIIKRLNDAKMLRKEVHFTIYYDGIWKIDIERHPYGCIRFWVIREDKRLNYNCTELTIYTYNDGIEHSEEFKIKQAVLNKAISAYKALLKAGCID